MFFTPVAAMGLALCHTLPRDPLTRAAALLAITACLLQIIAVCDAANRSRLRWMVGEVNGEDYAITPYEILRRRYQNHDHRPRICPSLSAESETELRSIHSASTADAVVGAVRDECHDFRTNGIATAILAAVSAGLTIIIFFFIAAGVVRHSHKNTHMLFAFTVLTALPGACTVAALAVQLDRMLPHAQSILQPFSRSGSQVVIRYSHGTYLMLFATLCYVAAITLAAAKLCWFSSESSTLKAEIHAEAARRAAAEGTGPHGVHDAPTALAEGVTGAPRPMDTEWDHDLRIDDRVAIRVVNDDWERQKAIWLERRRAVVLSLVETGLGTKEARMRYAAARQSSANAPH
jgi:hypothetical protein